MLTLVSKDSVKNSDHFDVQCIVCAYSMHGSGDNQPKPNVQKSKIQSYSVEHCRDVCCVGVATCAKCNINLCVSHLLRPKQGGRGGGMPPPPLDPPLDDSSYKSYAMDHVNYL